MATDQAQEPIGTAVGAESVRDEEVETGLLDLLIVLLKHKTLVLVLPCVVAVVAAVISMFLPNVYTATTRILPPQQGQTAASAMLGSLGSVAALVGGASGFKAPSDMYIAMLRSRTVADNLIQRFDLMRLYGVTYGSQARRALDGRTRVAASREGIITVDVEDEDATRAAAIANGFIEELYKLTSVLAITEASQRRLFFENQLKGAKDNLTAAEIGLRQTQEASGLITLDEQGRTIIAAVANLRAQITAKEVQLGVIRTFATESNRDYIATREEISGLKAQLERLEKTNTAGKGDIFVATGKVPAAALEYLRKLRDVKYHEAVFEILSKQYEIARIDEARDSAVVQVLDKAIVPDFRTRPERTKIVVVSAAIAALLGIFCVFFLEGMRKARENPRHEARMRDLRRYLVWRQ